MCPRSDDPRAENGGRYVLVGVASFALIAVVIAGLLVPPLAGYALLARGHGLLAGILFLAHALLLVTVFVKLFHKRHPR